MTLPGSMEAGPAGKQLFRLERADGQVGGLIETRTAKENPRFSRLSQDLIGPRDPDALQTPASGRHPR